MKRCAVPIRAWDGAQDVDDAPCEMTPVYPDGKCVEHSALPAVEFRRARHRITGREGWAWLGHVPDPCAPAAMFVPDESETWGEPAGLEELAWLEPSE